MSSRSPLLASLWKVNEEFLHKLITSSLKQPFTDFDNNSKFFVQECEKLTLFAYQFLEELVCCYYSVRSRIALPKFEAINLKEKATYDVDLPLLERIKIEDSGNKDDIVFSKNKPIRCSNIEFAKFSYNVCLAMNMEDSFERMLLVRYLRGKVTSMYELTKNDPIFSRGRRNIAYCYVRTAEYEIDKLFQQYADQRVQIHELVGPSGIGKTRAVNGLSKIIAALLPTVPMADLVYTRANDYWWNGYKGQPIILYDDFTHVRTKLKFDLNFELIAVASGTFRNPPMAFEKNMIFTSTLCIVTSNIPIMTTVAVAETANALRRRIVSQQWKPRSGLTVCEEGVYRYVCRGNFVNSIVTANSRSVFSLFRESLEIFEQNSNYEIQFDDFEWESIPCTSSMLTSSVPESHSAIVEEVGAPKEELLVSAQNNNSVAQVNQKVDEGAMFSNVATSIASYASSLFVTRRQPTPTQID